MLFVMHMMENPSVNRRLLRIIESADCEVGRAVGGFDVDWIDWEHAAMGVEIMTQMVHDVQFMSEGKSMALVRIPDHSHAAIGYALDAGASIMVPQVETVAQAKEINSASKFGRIRNDTRSAPPARLLGGISDTLLNPSLTIWENVNNQAAILIQIESLAGIHNLDAILAECGEHIDSVWIGTLDARVSMGLPGVWGEEPEWVEALSVFESTLAKWDTPAIGLALGPDMQAKRGMARGKSFVVSGSEIFPLMAMRGEAEEMHRESGAMDFKGVYKVL